MFVITGALKNYEWGSAEGLRPWTRGPSPLAELWFGVHPSGPSPLVDSADTLDQHLDADQAPILVKLLSAAKPLSIQVHPNREMAEHGFRELNQQDAYQGAFADPNEKIEMLYALENFDAFVGWRPKPETTAVLGALAELHADFARYAKLDFSQMAQVAGSLTDLGVLIALIPLAARNAGLSELDCAAYSTVAAEYPNDPGAILALYLRVVRLAPGESLFVPPGVPHSYIRGTGLEVMTSSDNVLRLGLTPKPVFIDLALQVLDFSEVSANASDAPFSIQVQSSSDAGLIADMGAYRVILCLEGTVSVSVRSSELASELTPGQAAILTAAEPEAQITTTGFVAVVTAGAK